MEETRQEQHFAGRTASERPAGLPVKNERPRCPHRQAPQSPTSSPSLTTPQLSSMSSFGPSSWCGGGDGHSSGIGLHQEGRNSIQTYVVAIT